MKQSRHIVRLECVDSTNTYLRTHPELWDRQLAAVMAREQTGGRGRFSRSWHSGPGLDLTFSAVFLPPRDAADIACVTLLAGLAAHRALRQRLGGNLHLKWPNDIRFGDRKLGGILCEAVFDAGRPAVIIGIGINVNSVNFPPPLDKIATSLRLASGADHDPDSLCEEILDRMSELLSHFRVPLEEGIVREWTAASRSIGKTARFVHGGLEREGVIEGINPDGSLLISLPDGSRINGHRGEVLFPEDD
jgi:BirA family transcriptional regulator, biotin operon repressor / biotin---[acetyl-CoA-carboxylase] ligase